MRCLGLDVGATHCRWEWWPAEAGAGGDANGMQPAAHGVDATVRALATVLIDAATVGRPIAAVCALAGAGDVKVARAIATGVQKEGVPFPVAVVGDVLAAAAAGLAEGAGVLVWAGTGSFAVARGRDGSLHRTGGRGWLLGDQGSGYDVVRRAAAAVLLAADELGPPTALSDALTRAFAAPSPQRLGAVLQQLDASAVAAQLPVVIAAAAAGDAVANDVIAQAASALAMLAAAAVRRAGLDFGGLPVALGGGVITNAPAFRAMLEERLRALGASAAHTLPPRAAARGAAWLAHGWHHREEPQHGWVSHVAL
jgi:N-acetylglucosamine kinase-like BadF-type ATPase